MDDVNRWHDVFSYQCSDTNVKRQIEIKKFFLIQEKVYFCKRNNLEYVKSLSDNKGEYVNHEKKDIR